jgi:YggT family protein
MIIAFVIDLIIKLYLIFLIIRLLVDESTLFFNPLLQPVYRATEPLIRLIQGPTTYFDRYRTFAISLVMMVLLVVRGIILHFVTTQVLLHSILSLSIGFFHRPGIPVSIVLSFMNFFDLLFQALVVIAVSLIVLPPYSTSPIVRFSISVMTPMISLTRSLFPFLRRGLPVTLLLLLLIFHAGINSALVGVLIVDDPGESIITPEGISGSLGDSMSSAHSPSMQAGGLPIHLILVSSLNLVLMSLGFFSLALIVNALLTWFSPDPFNPLVQYLDLLCRPILAPFRRFIPLVGGLDLSPVAAILLIEAARNGLNNLFLMLLRTM